jgi:tetratricopeptide (TPR) repeat protein
MTHPRRRARTPALFVFVLAGTLAAAPALWRPAAGWAADTPSPRPASRPEDPDYTAAVREIKASRFTAAIPMLERVVARDGSNADAYNWLGYATRRNGNPSGAVPYYEKALAIDPKHRGAHEYLGEAYLLLDDLPKARVHLARLDSLCFLPCSEYRDLKKAVEAYEKSGGKVKPTGTE